MWQSDESGHDSVWLTLSLELAPRQIVTAVDRISFRTSGTNTFDDYDKPVWKLLLPKTVNQLLSRPKVTYPSFNLERFH